jgi:hypothetical protein
MLSNEMMGDNVNVNDTMMIINEEKRQKNKKKGKEEDKDNTLISYK